MCDEGGGRASEEPVLSQGVRVPEDEEEQDDLQGLPASQGHRKGEQIVVIVK